MLVRHKMSSIILLMIIFMVSHLYGQQPPREYQRWGRFGVGKLVTTQNNLNCIADGQLRWPSWAHHPAMEYPFNSEEGGRHINYSVGISFHVGGFSDDYGPSYDDAEAEFKKGVSPRTESGDRTYYRYYDGFHYEGFPNFIPERGAGVPVSDDTTTWPLINGKRQFPDYYPTNDPYHDSKYPEYQNAYEKGLAEPIPIKKDSATGWPGAGENGELVADQESFSVNHSVNLVKIDPDYMEGKLMVYTTLRGLSFSGGFYDDFLVWIWTVTNVGTADIRKTYMGLKADFDFPWASYQAYSSYNKVDCYAYNEELQMGYGWDGDGAVPGATYGDWGQNVPAKLTDESIVKQPALAGVKFLKTPFNDENTERLGVTAFDAYCFHNKDIPYGVGSSSWEYYYNNVENQHHSSGAVGNDPDDKDGDGIDDWTWEHPYPMGNEQIYESGYKSEMNINTGPFTLKPGETDTIIAAVVMGKSRAGLIKNAKFAQQLYESDWNPIRPPVAPDLRIYQGSGRVKLIWNDRSENDSLNRAKHRQEFEGYKLYRSSDGGQTWGDRYITDENGSIVDYVPMEQWDLKNNITGASALRPTFNLGNDTGLDPLIEVIDSSLVGDTTIVEVVNGDTVFSGTFSAGDTTGRRIYVDNDVVDGFTYKYAVVSYSAEDVEAGIPPVQNAKTFGPNIENAIPHAPEATSKSELSNIKVVPNPYLVVADWEFSVDERKLKFTHLPEKCKIRIFNSAGEMVRKLEHNHMSPISSEEAWNMRTFENREVAPGLYYYHVSSEYGEHAGKFVIIK